MSKRLRESRTGGSYLDTLCTQHTPGLSVVLNPSEYKSAREIKRKNNRAKTKVLSLRYDDRPTNQPFFVSTNVNTYGRQQQQHRAQLGRTCGITRGLIRWC